MAEFIGNNIIKLKEVGSTNNYATALLAKEDFLSGTVVVADVQKNGRGQINNSWESEAGLNLLMSIVLTPTFLPVQYQFLLSKILALGVSDVLSYYSDNVRIKWPNDIYVGEKKIAGILIENSIMGNTLSTSILGLGLNINQTVFKSDAPNPISLKQLTKKTYELDKMLTVILNSVNKWYSKLECGFVEEIDEAYVSQLFRMGVSAKYNNEQGSFEGVICGVNEIGQLKIRTSKGEMKEFHFKEVEFIF